MVREIIKDTEFLKKKSEPASREDMQLIKDIADTLEANRERCVGLAANMIGESKTVLAAMIGGKVLVMVNPVITEHSSKYYETEEGCLSLTGVRPTKRYKIITVEYRDRSFKKKKAIFRDFEAQIIQHEIDHFEGILI
ncbi:MAG: peptide deformylase [Ruminococcus sp.]|nr:peptide deformylase [Ruminococcus sp.]